MILNSSVRFKAEDESIQKLYDTAKEKCMKNLKNFAGRPVLVEGGGYKKIWLETQPMGGEMYAKHNIEAALNNQLFFMETQREDGRLAGSIEAKGEKVIEPQFNKFQGFCFPFPALNMYYWIGKDDAYLDKLYNNTLMSRFGAKTRYRIESDGKSAKVFVNDEEKFISDTGVRLVTDESGALVRKVRIED